MMYWPNTSGGAPPAAGLRAVRLSGRLTQSPYAGMPYLSELRAWPLQHPDEYTCIGVFEVPYDQPVIMSPKQRDEWLADLVTSAKRAIPGINLTVVRRAGPESPLPAALLGEDVVLASESGPVVARTQADDRDGIFEIWQDIRTDGFSEGSNSLVLTMYGMALVEPFVTFAANHPDLSRLSDLSLLRLNGAVARRNDHVRAS
jgi:hypothetical protein